MQGKWCAAIVVACLSTTLLAACGGGGSSLGSASVAHQRAACMRRAGAETELAEVPGLDSTDFAMVQAGFPDGDSIFIVDLPDPGLAGKLATAVEEKMQETGVGGRLTSEAANQGSTLVMAVGVEGVDGGLAAEADETTGRRCATHPISGSGDPL